MKKSIDVRGLTCPQPVLNTKKVLDEGNFSVLEIIGDSEAAKENISSLLHKMNYQLLSTSQVGETFKIMVSGNEKQIHQDVDIKEVSELLGKVLFISSDKLGKGNDELGAMLMKAFTYSLTELKPKPAAILFMNSGVKLCIKGAETLENLQKLEKSGSKILVCGTCLNYYKITEQLQVGKISNMYEISEHLLGENGVVSL
jgi:selenium metabolism protein YedF